MELQPALKIYDKGNAELMITRISKQPAFDGAVPYILRGGVEGGLEADPEKQLKSSISHNILQYLETLSKTKSFKKPCLQASGRNRHPLRPNQKI